MSAESKVPLVPSPTLLETFMKAKLPPRRLLMVEDDEKLFKKFAALTAHFNCELMLVRTMGEALKAFRSWQPHAIWIDVKLGGDTVDDGLEVARYIRKIMPRFPLTFVSGWIDQHFLQTAKFFGVVSILLKPVDLTEDAVLAIMEHFHIPLRLVASASSEPSPSAGSAINLAATASLLSSAREAEKLAGKAATHAVEAEESAGKAAVSASDAEESKIAAEEAANKSGTASGSESTKP